MSRFVVVHHAHHPDEGVYRLVYGEAHEVEEFVEEANPVFEALSEDEALERMADPDFDAIVLRPTIVRAVQRTMFTHVQEVVWDHEDARWEGRSADEVAAAQRRDVKEAIDRRIAAAERQQAELAQRRVHELGGVGTEL